MKRSPRPKANLLPESFLKKLNSYALAASAAGVGLLALAHPAEGEIIYTKANTKILPKSTFQLDLNNDGTADFELKDIHSHSFFTTWGRLSVIPAQQGNQVWGHTYAHFQDFASAFYAGVKIGPKGQFLPGSGLMAASTFNGGHAYPGSASCTAPWANVSNRYLGFKFEISGEVHFGWARLNVACHNYEVAAVLTGYAYETVANRPILTGQTKGQDGEESASGQDRQPDSESVQPGSLGRLAQGAAGRF
jgi:hypothetical protein